MRVLFADDNRERLRALKRELPFFPEIVYARTTFAAQIALETERFDVLMLDHDFEDCQGEPTEDGTALAKWIAARDDAVGDPWVIAHSLNTACGRAMAGILDRGYGRAPMVVPFNAKTLAAILVSLRDE